MLELPQRIRALLFFVTNAAMLLLFFSLSAHAALIAYVDRNPVSIDESFKLIVESDQDNNGEPNFDALRNSFEVLGQSNSTNIQIINGKTTRKIQWFVTLIPKRIGNLTIPSFKVDGLTSKALTVKVTPARSVPSTKQGADVFMQVEVKPTQVYVQQQVIYTVRLYHSVNLAGGSRLTEPEFPDGNAIVKRLGDDREYQTVMNGVRYDVFERTYFIFPQKSGHFTIEPLVFDGQVVDQQRSGGFMFSPFNQSTHHKRVRSDQVELEVLATPAGVIGDNWLPASNLQLVEQWSETPPKFTVGEPVTRTITIMADGLTSAQLPAVQLQLPDTIKVYPDKVVLKDNEDSDGIAGIRQHKIALIPTQPGTLVLPEVKVNWWNTMTQKMAAARLPEQRFTITGTASSIKQAIPGTPPVAAGSAEQIKDSPATVVPVMKTDRPGWWPWIAFGLGIGWLTTVLLWWYQSGRHGSKQVTTNNTIQSEKISTIERTLKQACAANDATATKAALLAWAKSYWPDQAPTSLPALAQACAPELSQALLALDRTLYAMDQDTWLGLPLWQSFQQNKPDHNIATKKTATSLERLHYLGV